VGLGAGDAGAVVGVDAVVEVLAVVVVAELVVEEDDTALTGVPHRFGPPATKRRRTLSSTSTVCAQLLSGRMRRRKCPAVWRSHANFGNGAVVVLPGTSTEACARPKADDSPFARATHADWSLLYWPSRAPRSRPVRASLPRPPGRSRHCSRCTW